MKNSLKMLFLALPFVAFLSGCTSTTLGAGQGGHGPGPVNLRSAGNFVILAKSGVSTTGTTSITGNLGISPIKAIGYTGFSPVMDASNQFSTSSLVTGKLYAPDYADPTPANMTTAIADMQTAFTDAAGRSIPDHTELGAGNISGMTLWAGLYKWGTGVLIASDVTLTGSSNDVFIFQIAQDLTVSNTVNVHLTGGVQAKNVFWQVSGQTTLGTTVNFSGTILCQTQIAMQTTSVLNGRAYAQTDITLQSDTVTQQ